MRIGILYLETSVFINYKILKQNKCFFFLYAKNISCFLAVVLYTVSTRFDLLLNVLFLNRSITLSHFVLKRHINEVHSYQHLIFFFLA